jgi:hypothetical protein
LESLLCDCPARLIGINLVLFNLSD